MPCCALVIIWCVGCSSGGCVAAETTLVTPGDEVEGVTVGLDDMPACVPVSDSDRARPCEHGDPIVGEEGCTVAAPVSSSWSPRSVVYTTVNVAGVSYAVRVVGASGTFQSHGLLSSKITSRVTCTFLVIGSYTR